MPLWSLRSRGSSLPDHARDHLAQVRAALAERHRMDAVRKHHLGDVSHVFHNNLFRAVVGSLGLRGARAHQVGAVPVHLERDRDLRDQAQNLARQLHLGKGLDRLGDLRADTLLRFGVLLIEEVGIVLPHRALLDDRDALVEVAYAFDVDTQPEPVEELRPQLALFWGHGPDDDDAARVRDRHTLTLDGVDAHRRRIEQHVNDVVVEQVDLVDVKDVAVGFGEHSRLKASRAFLQRRLEVDGADHTVLGRVDRQLDDAHAPGGHRQLTRAGTLAAVETEGLGIGRVATEMKAFVYV